MVSKKEALKDAIWHLTCSSSALRGLNGFEDIEKEILKLREVLKQKG
jgi:hypothetical protein